ncbi:MAG TPA: sensor domain-containing diguanylate cyclase [Fervidobacterium sp.]|nr:sensor domain-containing diguanylate cyclase [Fervidobacterium sp.]
MPVGETMDGHISIYCGVIALILLITVLVYIHVYLVKKRRKELAEKDKFLSMLGSIVETENLGLTVWSEEKIVYMNSRIIAHLQDAGIDIKNRQQVKELLKHPEKNLVLYDVLRTISTQIKCDEDFNQTWTKEIAKRYIELTYIRKKYDEEYYSMIITRDVSMEFLNIENQILMELIDLLSEEISKDNIDLKEIGERIKTLLSRFDLVDTFAIAQLQQNGEIYFPYFKVSDTDDRSGLKYGPERKGLTRYVIDKELKILIRNSETEAELPDGYRIQRTYNEPLTDYGVPIIYRNFARGAVLFEKRGIDQFSDSTISLFEKVASIITLALCFIEILQDVQYERKRFFELSIKDYLTGAYSRRFLEQYLEKELSKSKRTNRPVSVVFMDIDKFKEINDKYGHIYGDSVLKNFVDIINKSIRSMDLVARYGGDEFILVFPETDATHAQIVTERIIDSLAKQNLSVSYGIIDATAFDSIEDVYKEVDDRMYGMKRRNGDC